MEKATATVDDAGPPGGADAPARVATLEEFASITAAVGSGVPLAESLAEAGLSLEAWESSQQTWLARLAADAQSGRLELGRRYTALARTKSEAAVDRAIRGRRKLVGAVPVAPKHRIGRWARTSVAAPPPMQPVQATRTRPPTSPPNDGEQTRFHTLGTSAPRDALPFRPLTVDPLASVARIADPPAPAEPPAPAATPDPLGETSMFSLPDAATRAVLPFSGANRDEGRRAALDRSAAADARRKTEVLAFDPAVGAAPDLPGELAGRSRTAELPVVRRATERIELPSAPGGRREDFDVGAIAEPPRDPLATTQTGVIDLPGAALPFAPPSDVPELHAGGTRRDALPFTAPPAPDERIDRISLAEYAQICAAVRLDPDGALAVGAAHGLDAEAWHALHVRWRVRFQSDPGLHARWGALVIAFASRGG